MLGIFGVLMIASAASRSEGLSLAILFLAGASMVTVFATFMTLVQTNVEEGMRGGCERLLAGLRGAMPLGNLAAGILAAAITAPWVLVGTAWRSSFSGESSFFAGVRRGHGSLAFLPGGTVPTFPPGPPSSRPRPGNPTSPSRGPRRAGPGSCSGNLLDDHHGPAPGRSGMSRRTWRDEGDLFT